MRPALYLFLLILAGAPGLAADEPKDNQADAALADPAVVAPPPSIDDAGTPAAPVEAELPEKIQPIDRAEPAVTIRREGKDTVEEYRREGRIYMIRVVPDKGIPYTYMDTDGDGRLESDGKDGPVRPVYYTLYEWE